MASTFSKLKIELMTTGEQSGTWGSTTNNNLGSDSTYRGLEQAIVGMATLVTGDFTSNSYTLPYTDSNDDQDFRCLVLNITATLSAAGTVTVPAIQKPYIIMNNSVGGFAVTVKVSGQTGISVPNGAKVLLYNNGTDVGTAVTYLTSLTLGSALPVASGGTGLTAGTSGGVLYYSAAGTLASSGALAANSLVVGGGAGVAPSTVTTGANVLTALGVAVGSSGAFTTNNAANTFSAAQTFRAANAVRSEAASTQDAIILAGRAGGSSSFAVTLTPATLASSTTLTLPNVTDTVATIGTAQTFTAAQTFRAANAVRSEAASTQDAVVLAGRAGGTGSFAVTLTPTTLSASRTLTLPNVTDTLATIGTAQTFTAAQTFRAASAVRSEAAATQDAIVIAGRAGGTSSYAVTLTPATLSASRTVTLPDGGGNYTLGYLNIPAVGTKSGSYILSTADIGKYVQLTTGGSITIPDATFAEGDVVSLFNNTTGTITITCTITTAYIAGTDADKATMTLATRGLATIFFISGTVCVVTGNVT